LGTARAQIFDGTQLKKVRHCRTITWCLPSSKRLSIPEKLKHFYQTVIEKTLQFSSPEIQLRVLSFEDRVRWARTGSGKSGGVRVIYYNMLEEEEVWLLTLYAKNERSTIPGHELKLIKEAIERG